MSIQGPNPYDEIYRIQPIDRDRGEDGQDERRHRRVKYQGRSWAESEEDLPVQPKDTGTAVHETEDREKARHALFADKLLLARAHKLFASLTTVEEKVAQLAFVECIADYSPEELNAMELIIQAWQVGGLLFTSGNYKRQSYLIEHFQDLSKTPLLIGNDFLQGLSFYYEGHLPTTLGKGQRLTDLAKAVTVQNRRMGVHFQYEGERSDHGDLTPEQMRDFRRGVREAQGIVAREKNREATASLLETKTSELEIEGHAFKAQLGDPKDMQEAMGLKTLNIFDLTRFKGDLRQAILTSMKESHEAFLLDSNVKAFITEMSELVKEGHILESELDRRVLKILIFKAFLPK